MRSWLSLGVLMSLAMSILGQSPGTVEVKLFGAEGQDEAKAVWADSHGVIMAGETTSDIVMAEGQAVWAPGGPLGRKGFVTVFDTALNWSWSFAFVGSPGAPLDAPSALLVRDVVRSPSDSATAWVLYDAPVGGQWESTLMGVNQDNGVIARHTWSSGGVTTSAALVPVDGSNFMWVGHESPSSVPDGPAGIRLGMWDGQTESDPTSVWLDGGEDHVPVAADWWSDTLSIAALGPNPEAPSAILRVSVVNGNPEIVGVAPIADPNITIHDVTAGPEGVAWSGTLLNEDGTLDAVYGRLSSGPEPDTPSVWGQAWIQVTASAEDRPGRAIQWSGDVVQCAARTTTEGAGSTGILLQTRFGPTGAWFGAHTFGGEGEEEITDMALDDQGRLLLVGASNSWTALGAGNGSLDAALFRLSTQQLNNGFETVAAQAVLPSAAFVGLDPIGLADSRMNALTVQCGSTMQFAQDAEWALFDSRGRNLARQKGGAWTWEGSDGWRILLESDGRNGWTRTRVWVAQ